MATYYVRPDGNNSNAGTGPAAGQAWQTLARIVQAGTAFTSGDTVYIAPGTYRQSITTTATYTSATNFFGDPTAAQFSGVTPGIVRITNFLSSDNVAATSTLLWGGVTFDYINISNIYFDHTTLNGGIYYTGTGNNSSIKNCVFSGNQASSGGVGTPAIRLTSVKNLLIDNCIFMRSYYGIFMTTTTDNDTNIDIRNSFFTNNNGGLWLQNGVGGGINVTNNLFSGSQANGVFIQNAGNATAISNVTNNIFYGCVGSVSGGSAINIVENYNRRVGSGGNTTVQTGAFTVTDGAPQFDFGHTSLFGLAVQKPFSSIVGSVNVGAGLSTYASTTDLYGQTWSAGASFPDIGCAAAVQASGTSYYFPSERNASTITIAPGSTSQSIELYLGATGLTASTTGLSAYYNRTRTASVNIPLVARTIAQAWISGGFAEVDSTNMPGVYRLDVPDAAVAANADDVTIVVRGASGTNGAVMTVTLIEEPTDAVLVRMGPFEVKADGLGASDPLDIQKGAQHGVDIQCVDAFGSGIDITSATVTAKVYNSGATLVDTYSCTATYAADGRATFEIDTTVTNTPGTYTATITRTTGASDTQIFGPLRIYVRDI